MRSREVLVAGFTAVSISLAASADTISYMDTIPLQSTNWVNSVSIPKFNPALGFLDSIELKLKGNVEGSIEFESLDAGPATVTTSLAAMIQLKRPDNSLITAVTPNFNTSDNVTAFDGVIDFGGGSGRSYFDLNAMELSTYDSPPPLSDLALFTGVGNILLPVQATAVSTAGGAGNLLAAFVTNAGATVMVTYNYTIPEPATMGLMSLGALGLLRRRRP